MLLTSIILILLQLVGWIIINAFILPLLRKEYKEIISLFKSTIQNISITQVLLIIIRSFIIAITAIAVPITMPTFWLIFILVYLFPFTSMDHSIWNLETGNARLFSIIVLTIVNFLLFTIAILLK